LKILADMRKSTTYTQQVSFFNMESKRASEEREENHKAELFIINII